MIPSTTGKPHWHKWIVPKKSVYICNYMRTHTLSEYFGAFPSNTFELA